MQSTLYITHPTCSLHMMHSWHPEAPQRLDAINDRLMASGLYSYLEHQEAPKATEDDILRCHTPEYMNFIKNNIPETGYFDVDSGETFLNPHTWHAALRAAGSGILAVDEIMQERAKNAFCAVRPPGHHAEPDRSIGFCFFNNLAIAARYAIEKYGLQRVAVFDFDVHHGNGTEKIFENDPCVEMFSFFQFTLFPFSNVEHAAPNMHNSPLPAYTGMKQVRDIVEQHWIPRMQEFKPEMIFVSAGFDAHREDEMGQMDLVEKDYVWLTEILLQMAEQYSNNRLISFLEGGYSLSALGRSATEHIRTLVGL